MHFLRLPAAGPELASAGVLLILVVEFLRSTKSRLVSPVRMTSWMI
jgi:hypothetical protein